MNAVDVVQRQVDAYNARDLRAFLANFSEQIAIYRMPAPEPALTGKAALAEFYAHERFNLPQLRADILARIAMGNKVIDHERIHGVRAAPFETAAVYEVIDGLIARAWFFAPE